MSSTVILRVSAFAYKVLLYKVLSYKVLLLVAL